jgi:hypothetical protein
MVIINEPAARLELTDDGDLTLATDGVEAALELGTADLVALIAAATAALAARAA